jgi:2,4-dienoyl-CoA reductase (NADPH2)
MTDSIFEPLKFRNLQVKNRLMRSNVSGRFDNYDGSGGQARINWEERFAAGGVGAIMSAFVPVSVRGRIAASYAMIDADDKIPFWTAVGTAVHRHDCRFILQLSHSGRQQDFPGIENAGKVALSSTSKAEPFHGFRCRAMTVAEIEDAVDAFAEGARRAREAGLDGVELHAANGYLITQFLSSGINDRTDQYGGSLANRARFLLGIVRAIRKRVGDDYHLQVKISAIDYNNVMPWEKPGNTLEDTIQVCKWVEEAGADALHISLGSLFPHPLNPPGELPVDETRNVIRILIATGDYSFRNYLALRYRLLQPIFLKIWSRMQKGRPFEGVGANEAGAIKRAVTIPVISTGGYQTASVIRGLIDRGVCDAVSMARTLIANPDLPKAFAAGADKAERPCSYCNKCLLNVLEHPMGCYDVRRFDGDHDAMIRQVMSVFDRPPVYQ